MSAIVRSTIPHVEPKRPVVDVEAVQRYAATKLIVKSISPRQPFTCAQPVIPGFSRWRAE